MTSQTNKCLIRKSFIFVWRCPWPNNKNSIKEETFITILNWTELSAEFKVHYHFKVSSSSSLNLVNIFRLLALDRLLFLPALISVEISSSLFSFSRFLQPTWISQPVLTSLLIIPPNLLIFYFKSVNSNKKVEWNENKETNCVRFYVCLMAFYVRCFFFFLSRDTKILTLKRKLRSIRAQNTKISRFANRFFLDVNWYTLSLPIICWKHQIIIAFLLKISPNRNLTQIKQLFLKSTFHDFPMWWKTNARWKIKNCFLTFRLWSRSVFHFFLCFLVGKNYRDRRHSYKPLHYQFHEGYSLAALSLTHFSNVVRANLCACLSLYARFLQNKNFNYVFLYSSMKNIFCNFRAWRRWRQRLTISEWNVSSSLITNY